MFLIDAVEEGGGDGIVAVLFGEFAEFSEAEGIAVDFATLGEILGGRLVFWSCLGFWSFGF